MAIAMNNSIFSPATQNIFCARVVQISSSCLAHTREERLTLFKYITDQVRQYSWGEIGINSCQDCSLLAVLICFPVRFQASCPLTCWVAELSLGVLIFTGRYYDIFYCVQSVLQHSFETDLDIEETESVDETVLPDLSSSFQSRRYMKSHVSSATRKFETNPYCKYDFGDPPFGGGSKLQDKSDY